MRDLSQLFAVECIKSLYFHRIQVGQFFELILFVKTYLGGSLALSSQTVGSLLMPPGTNVINIFTAVIYGFS